MKNTKDSNKSNKSQTKKGQGKKHAHTTVKGTTSNAVLQGQILVADEKIISNLVNLNNNQAKELEGINLLIVDFEEYMNELNYIKSKFTKMSELLARLTGFIDYQERKITREIDDAQLTFEALISKQDERNSQYESLKQQIDTLIALNYKVDPK